MRRFAIPIVAGISLCNMSMVAFADGLVPQPQNAPRSAIAANNSSEQVKKIYRMVKKPTTPNELLQNLKLALDDGLLMREDFYTSSNFERFFSARNITEGIDKDQKGRRIDASSFGYPASRPADYPAIYPDKESSTDFRCGNGLAAGINTLANGKVSSGITLGFISGAPTFGEVEKVFGNSWKEDRSPFPQGYILQRSTGPHAHEKWVYSIDNASVKGKFFLMFGSAGTLTQASISLEAK